jgi:hypothetical protein
MKRGIVMKKNIVQSSVVATLALLMVAGPLLNSSTSYAIPAKDDEKKMDKLEKEKAEPQKQLDTDTARLNKLKAAKTVADLDALGIKGDCFTNCAPSSAGGKCPDILFTDGVITAGAAVSVTDKKFIVTDHDQIKADLAVAYPAVTNAEGASLCEAVKPQLDKYAYLGGLQGCQDAVSSCRWLAADKEKNELEKSTIPADKDALAAIDKQITAISNREDDMANTDCTNCQADYYGQGPGEMNGAQKFALIAGALTPVLGMGMNAAMTIHGQSTYANEYNTYCGTGLTIGIPCNAPSALTGTFGGGLSTATYGGGGYGYSLGGLSSGGYSFAGGGLGGAIGIGLGGGGISSPYAFGGGGISSPYSFAGGGLGGGIGMASPYAYAGVGMATPFLGGGGISSPYSFAGGGLGGAIGIGLGGGGISSPFSFAGGGLGGGIGISSPYAYGGGISSPYSFAGGGFGGGISSPYSFAGGGFGGGISSPYSFAGGGLGGAIGGGIFAGGGFASTGAPFSNPYGGGGFSFAGGGLGGGISSPYSFAGGGFGGGISSPYSFAGGGLGGGISSPYSFAGGGLGGAIGIAGGIGYAASPYGASGGIGYNPYSGYNPSSQYSQLYQASLSEQMLNQQRAAQSQQDVMLSQQQLYQAQARYGETAQQASQYMGGYGGSGLGIGIGGSYGGYGGIGSGYNGYMGGAPITGGGGGAL